MLFPVMLQGWHDISFFHWSCDPALLQPRLPRGLEIDTFDGKAWISLTPFLLRGLRPPLTPRPLSLSFPETNLRTYVNGRNGPGIWFFSLDAANFGAVIGARTTYRLPYYWADMQVQIRGNQVVYFSNRGGRARTRITIVRQEEIIEPSALDDFLTARFRLYSGTNSKLLTAQVEHPAWKLHRLRVIELEETLRRAAGVDFALEEFLTHYSPGVDTRIGPPQTVSLAA
jgi:uncharacterized protein